MEAEPKPAQVLGAIRRQWVRFRGLRYGQSNLVLEAELRASARAACKFLTKVDNISLVLDEKLPEWMDEAMMKHLVLGEELPAGRDPPKVPEPAEVVVRRRSDASRGFDLFCVVQRDDLRPKAVKLRNQAKFRGKPIAALIKVVAGRSWAKCKKPENKSTSRGRRQPKARECEGHEVHSYEKFQIFVLMQNWRLEEQPSIFGQQQSSLMRWWRYSMVHHRRPQRSSKKRLQLRIVGCPWRRDEAHPGRGPRLFS